MGLAISQTMEQIGLVAWPLFLLGGYGWYLVLCLWYGRLPNPLEVKIKLTTIGVIAKVSPLLGLLGTVNGMIKTFEGIAYYGQSNPLYLSEGISEALLSTQSGLIVSFPLLLMQVLLSRKVL